MPLTDKHSDHAMYKAWLDSLGETNDKEIEHLRNCIRESINTDLTKLQRTYLLMYMSGHTVTEIATEYNVHPATVSRTLNRALDSLFEHIRYATPTTLRESTRGRKYLTSINKGE